MTLADETEISHSSMASDGTVQVYFEIPCEGGFQHATCILPSYQRTENQGYSQDAIKAFDTCLYNNAHFILEFAQNGGFAHATAV